MLDLLQNKEPSSKAAIANVIDSLSTIEVAVAVALFVTSRW